MTNNSIPALDMAEVRARLEQARGPEFWRSLEELADTEEFRDYLRHEFPRLADASLASIDRRGFMKLMAASLALAGVSGCGGPPQEEILPYVHPPEEIVPGKPLFFATAMLLDGFANGVLVESNMGRPIKVEGNPEHPASLGATDAFGQASVLQLWDPDRAQTLTRDGRVRTWEHFRIELQARLRKLQRGQGKGLRVLAETVTSPTMAAQLQALLDKYPEARWHQYQPVGYDRQLEGARLAFGEPLQTRYRFERARVIVALDADFLSVPPGHVRYARDFARGRRVEADRAEMNRLYVAEATPTITGAMADHRVPLRASRVEALARALASALGLDVEPAADALPEVSDAWISAVAEDLSAHRGSSLVVVGETQPPAVHALAHALNDKLANVGETLAYTAPVVQNPSDQGASLRALTHAMAAGEVDTLLIVDANPVYNAPADLDFGKHLENVDFTAQLSLYADETANACTWHIPKSHFLEAWGDARAFDGTASIVQPVIAPLYASKSAHELLAALLGETSGSGHDIVRGHWKSQYSGDNFETFWQDALRKGVIEGTRLPAKSVSLKGDWAARLEKSEDKSSQDSSGLEIGFSPDPSVWDGQFANNAWLQEIPRPLTKLTWDNAALVSPATAQMLGLAKEDVVELRYRGRKVRAPVWIEPGHADGAVSVHLGYGRSRAGRVGDAAGFNAYALRVSDAPWFDTGLELRKTGERYALATTQNHYSMEGRDIVREGTLGEFRRDPQAIAHGKPGQHAPTESLYPEYRYDGYKWGMAINLNTCIGCNACTIACQAENNIPVVGKDQVIKGREMHWIRVDRYYKGPLDNPESYAQPVPCMQCERAPCELVCPVIATMHDSEGLNVQVYNRCVGTRFCSNNCPYKVRRFNFLQYSKHTPTLKAQKNPEVTVRQRGVMEKCTYCVQRINAARIEAEKADRRIRDGELVTACQAVCPTEAIVFGDLNDPSSQVNKAKASPLDYGLLAELNTRPRTTYGAALRNPNPKLAG